MSSRYIYSHLQGPRGLCRIIFVFVMSIFTITSCSTVGSYKERTGLKAAQGPASSHIDHIELTTGKDPYGVAVADFNGDGIKDIAVVSHAPGDLRIYWGRPGRRFDTGPVYGEAEVGYHPGIPVAYDWDGDGHPDLIIACEGLHEVQFWKNMGSSFKKEASFPVPCDPVGIAVADLDGDGRPDIVLAPYSGDKIFILWNKGGKGEFKFDIQQIDAGGRNPTYVSLGDWNGDGRPDIFWAINENDTLWVAVNKGGRRFERRLLYKAKLNGLARWSPRSLSMVRLNEKGEVAAIAPLETGKGALVVYGDGKGNVTHTAVIPAPVWGYSGIGVMDAADGRPALIGLGEEGKVFVVSPKDDGTWLNSGPLPAGSLPLDLQFYDLDGDGEPDLIFVNSAGSTLGIDYGPLIGH
ncbi:FG-GAP repeat domain-containing protein [Dissulfurimicrobium hydrothermale]|uniref:FG-GAP repeat domain-containing protein n=1 Tax=Dissulfurimicrobium hydrothermale TaxID=1750598 RepID=UPI001ED9F030|nr:VCBS repeat-containing protein [Dissulfurimicrobium hydrothermale]UKL13798.1 VCBS repeat-containing protein [Dissulfurimicrobium hydrothermale]